MALASARLTEGRSTTHAEILEEICEDDSKVVGRDGDGDGSVDVNLPLVLFGGSESRNLRTSRGRERKSESRVSEGGRRKKDAEGQERENAYIKVL